MSRLFPSAGRIPLGPLAARPLGARRDGGVWIAGLCTGALALAGALVLASNVAFRSGDAAPAEPDVRAVAEPVPAAATRSLFEAPLSAPARAAPRLSTMAPATAVRTAAAGPGQDDALLQLDLMPASKPASTAEPAPRRAPPGRTAGVP